MTNAGNECQELNKQLAAAVEALRDMETKHGYIPEVLRIIALRWRRLENEKYLPGNCGLAGRRVDSWTNARHDPIDPGAKV